MGGQEAPRSADRGEFTLEAWRAFPDIITDSLWQLGARDHASSHSGDYWGNFVPQIPNQILRRFTRPGDWVVDLFSGMGTTLIECRRLGRNGIGIELNAEIAEQSRHRIAAAEGSADTTADVLVGDSTSPTTIADLRARLGSHGRVDVDCAFLHPPYHDIIRFSTDARDLSNAPDEATFLRAFGTVASHTAELVRPGGHVALVIGDAFSGGRLRPLGFRAMDECMKAGLTLRAINVKDIQGNVRGKGKATNLWRYRALKMGLYVFKHEYVILFRR